MSLNILNFATNDTQNTPPSRGATVVFGAIRAFRIRSHSSVLQWYEYAFLLLYTFPLKGEAERNGRLRTDYSRLQTVIQNFSGLAYTTLQ